MNFEAMIRGILGLGLLIGIAFLLSNNKRKINWRLVFSGIGLQVLFAIFIIKGDYLASWWFPLGWPKLFFKWVSSFFVLILNFTTEGAKFIFGNLAISPGQDGSLGMFFAFQVLPTIIFFASLMAILYQLGIMQRVVQAMAWIMSKIMGTSGANLFLVLLIYS